MDLIEPIYLTQFLSLLELPDTSRAVHDIRLRRTESRSHLWLATNKSSGSSNFKGRWPLMDASSVAARIDLALCIDYRQPLRTIILERHNMLQVVFPWCLPFAFCLSLFQLNSRGFRRTFRSFRNEIHTWSSSFSNLHLPTPLTAAIPSNPTYLNTLAFGK